MRIQISTNFSFQHIHLVCLMAKLCDPIAGLTINSTVEQVEAQPSGYFSFRKDEFHTSATYFQE